MFVNDDDVIVYRDDTVDDVFDRSIRCVRDNKFVNGDPVDVLHVDDPDVVFVIWDDLYQSCCIRSINKVCSWLCIWLYVPNNDPDNAVVVLDKILIVMIILMIY